MEPRFSRVALVSVFAFALAAFAAAQDDPTPSTQPIFRHRLRECLSILDLTDQQKADIQATLDAAAPTIEGDVAAVRAARQTLQAALEATPPDACAIGADALALRAARGTLRAGRDSIRQQVLGTLTPDQQARLQGCLGAPWPDAGPDAADPAAGE